MEKIIWTITDKRDEMIEAQRRINSIGSMRALCMLSTEALEKAIMTVQENITSRANFPSLIIIDYDMAVKDDCNALGIIKNQRYVAGVPLFIMIDKRTKEIDEECYSLGAMVVLSKPFSKSGILRIERIAWQYEVTKNYEKTLQKQAMDLQAAREIMRLNKQLEARNELLYQVFGRYFSDSVVEVILEHPEGVSIGGKKTDMTVMMADLRGFTAMSTRLEPDVVTSILNVFFDRMLEIIIKYDGTVIELLGDCILAVFGAPLPSKEHTANAIATAIEMQNAMRDINIYCEEYGYPNLEIGIGLHRGNVFIGNVGSERMMRYNVIGSVVNECSRIEGLSVGGQVLISESSIENISVPVSINSRISVNAKGLPESIGVCDIAGIGGDYNVYIEADGLDRYLDISDKVKLLLYPVENKMVKENAVTSELKKISDKRAIVQMTGEEIKVFKDVLVKAITDDDGIVFDGVYAKIIDKKDNVATLHFTHVNQGFTLYIETINNDRG